MELANSKGKFTLTMENEKFIINEWQGETKEFSANRIPVSEIADCLTWLSAAELKKLETMIGKGRYQRARAYAVKMRWISNETE